MSFRKGCILLIWMLQSGCQSSNLDSYYIQGNKIVRDLGKELEQIHTEEDMKRCSSKIKKKMRRLTALMIAAKEYSEEHPQEKEKKDRDSIESDKLRYEMIRICEEIEGAKNLLEAIQEETLDKIDLHEKKLHKKKRS